MSNEIANHTDIILKKIKDLQTPQPDKDKEEYKKKLLPRTKKKKPQNMSALPTENRDTVLLTALKKPPKEKKKKRPTKVLNASIAGKKGTGQISVPTN